MKKHYFIFAAALMALASCSTDDVIGGAQTAGNTSDEAINFASEMGKITRAADSDKHGVDAATALDNNFVVVGYKGKETKTATGTLVFDHYNVNYKQNTAGSTESNTKDWEYVGQEQNVKGANNKLATQAGSQTIKYWDLSCPSYDFLAFSMGKGQTTNGQTEYATPTAVTKNEKGQLQYTLKGDVNTLSECYISNITTVLKANYKKDKAVEMQFRHATSKVRIALYETVPGYVISDVKFYADANSTDNAKEEGQLYGDFNKKGTMTVYFPTTGTDNQKNADYNKAHVTFSRDADGKEEVKNFGKVNYNNQVEDQIQANAGYLSQNSATPSYCGTETYYQTVLPAEDASQPATIRIDYKLTSTDGSKETINVKGATATIPAEYTAWKPGFAYTYKFKIAQNTNGTTGDPSTDDKGLTAISFDAVVLNDEETGKQETITTVSTPSITTYGWDTTNKKVTENGNEYAANTEIYATVHIPATGAGQDGQAATKATTVAPTALYTVTIDNDAATQTINEATVANAIKNGTKSGDDASATYTVTDVNGKKLTVTKATAETVTTVPTAYGYNLTVNAIKWTATAGTIYAVEYVDANGSKTYKIVNVAK